MREGIRSVALKAAATATTLLAIAGAALYVGGHQHSQSAPLHPRVLDQVQTTDAAPLTSTYVS